MKTHKVWMFQLKFMEFLNDNSLKTIKDKYIASNAVRNCIILHQSNLILINCFSIDFN